MRSHTLGWSATALILVAAACSEAAPPAMPGGGGGSAGQSNGMMGGSGSAGMPGASGNGGSAPVPGGGAGGSPAGAGAAGMSGAGGMGGAPAGVSGMGGMGDAGEAGMSSGGMPAAGSGAGGDGVGGGGMTDNVVAVAEIATTGADADYAEIGGQATFSVDGNTVTMVLELTGCPEGTHVSHIHDTGDCGNNGDAAGGHWQGTGGGAGANGEIIDQYECDAVTNTATYTLTTTTDEWTFGEGDNNVLNRSLMVHLGTKANPGARVACGVITAP